MKVLFILIFLFTLSEYTLITQIEKFLSKKKEIILQSHKTAVLNEYKVIVNILRDLSQNTFKGFINKPKILQALKNEDRDLLYKLLHKDYSYLKKVGFKQVHFHLPDNSSFLRMHQPHKFGDNLESSRYSVAYTNKYKKFIEGLESGRVVPGYRFVYPLFLNSEYLGSVELSFSINKIVNEIERVYNTHTHFLINKNIFNKKVFNEFQNLYMDSIEHSDYMKLNRSYLNKIEPWYDDQRYKQTIEKGMKTEAPFNFEIDIMHGDTTKHTHMIVTFLPIWNINKSALSYFVFYSESENLLLIEEEKYYAKIISSMVLVLLFIAGYLVYLHRKNLEQAKTSLEKFNKELSSNVKKKTKELYDLNKDLAEVNQTLEEKIEKEVTKNREKDLYLFLQSKKASMGEMVGAIAHQWRQPLNELSIRIQKLQYDYQHQVVDDAYIELFIRKNKNTIRFMSKTIDGFRNFFRIDKEKRDFSIKEAIEDITLMLNGQFEHFRISITIEGEDFIYHGFKTEFQQVILNILNNAKDAFEESEIESPKITIMISNNRIVIKDNGNGVPLSIEYKIFDPYFTTKEEGQGTGMGLYISKTIIEDNMGGKLYLENSSNGASFHIEF